MMRSKNPCQRELARVEIVHSGGRFNPSANRPILQANALMRARLASLLKWRLA